MWELDYKESWVLKNWCFWTVVLEKTLESPLECKVIKAINPKGNQSWISIGRTEAEAAAPILWPPDGKNWLTGKYPDAGKDWRQVEKGLQRMRWLDDIADLKDMSLRRIRELAMENETQGTAVHGVAKRWTRLSDWAQLKNINVLPQWLSSKGSSCNAGDLGDLASILEWGRSPGGGHANPLHYSWLGNPMNRRPVELWSMVLQRVRHVWVTEHSTAQSNQYIQELVKIHCSNI